MPERSAWSSLAWGLGGVSGEPERAGNGAAAGVVSVTFFCLSAVMQKSKKPPACAGGLFDFMTQ